jgi:hypothetical protein
MYTTQHTTTKLISGFAILVPDDVSQEPRKKPAQYWRHLQPMIVPLPDSPQLADRFIGTLAAYLLQCANPKRSGSELLMGPNQSRHKRETANQGACLVTPLHVNRGLCKGSVPANLLCLDVSGALFISLPSKFPCQVEESAVTEACTGPRAPDLLNFPPAFLFEQKQIRSLPAVHTCTVTRFQL